MDLARVSSRELSVVVILGVLDFIKVPEGPGGRWFHGIDVFQDIADLRQPRGHVLNSAEFGHEARRLEPFEVVGPDRELQPVVYVAELLCKVGYGAWPVGAGDAVGVEGHWLAGKKAFLVAY